MGRLTREPDIRYSQGQEPITIASFTLAVNRKYKKDGEQGADFINCKAFKKTAEVIEKYCVKGTKVVISGRIQAGSYTNKDGNKVYTTDVMVEEFEFAESKRAAEENNTCRPQPSTDENGFMNIPEGIDEELPFN